jgi:hypothetical protein
LLLIGDIFEDLVTLFKLFIAYPRWFCKTLFTIFTIFYIVYLVTRDTKPLKLIFNVTERFNLLSKQVMYGADSVETSHFESFIGLIAGENFLSSAFYTGSFFFASLINSVRSTYEQAKIIW